MRILLADDQKDIRLLATEQLETNGHRVVAVADGEEALGALRRERFDVILLDEEMPRMTGTQVLHTIRAGQHQSTNAVVIALTGYNTDPDKERLLKAGFDAVLGKPFRLDSLEGILRASTSGKASPTLGLPSQAGSSTDLLTQLGGDEQLLRDMARTFLRDLPPRLAEIQKCIRQRRSEKLASCAHALKGSLSIFGAGKAAMLCGQLQDSAKTARFADAARILAALEEAIAELEANLRGYAREKRADRPGESASKTKRRLPDSD